MADSSDTLRPTGTVTFLFTDIEGSTRLLQKVGNAYPEILAGHHHLIREALASFSGVEVTTEGDAFFAVFRRAGDGVAAAVAAQRALAAQAWPSDVAVRVRMGLHTGEAGLAGGEYIGLDVHRAARIAAAANGGQVLISESTRELVVAALPEGVSLADKGEHHLKDLDRPEHLYQVVIAGLPADFPPIRSVSARFEILPGQLSSFIGRTAEVDRIRELLDGTRLLTLTGPGGTGKTRLSIQAALAASEAFPDGVAFVPLAPISDPQLVAGTIQQTLGLKEELGRTSVETIADRIQRSRMLLILDNFEQVLGASEVVTGLLERTQEPKILVTSRAPLHLSGEQDFPVPPMRLPDAGDAGNLEVLTQSEAVALFMQRASTVRPDFTLSASNAMTIVEICARLDGLPLAIELAASRIRLLPPEALLSRLQHRLDLLQSSATDRTDRQRTLRGAIDWSYDLLAVGDRAVFRRLAIFVGGWDLGDAEAVAAIAVGDTPDLLDTLERLVDHSLVRQDAESGEPRFGMLETIREYGVEQLREAGDLDVVARAHGERFLGLAIELGPEFTASPASLDRAGREHDNIRAALRWAIDAGELELVMEAAGALWRFWHLRGHLREGDRWTTEVLGRAADEPSHGRTRALNGLAGLRYWMGDYVAARMAYQGMLDGSRAIDDGASEAEANYSLGFIHSIDRDYEAAREAYRESHRVAERIGDRTAVANALMGSGFTDFLDGRYAEARDSMLQVVPLFKAIGDEYLYLNAVGVLGRALQYLGQHVDARTAAIEQLDGALRIGDGTMVAMALHDLASDATQQADFERGLRLEGASRALVERLGGGAPNALMGVLEPEQVAAKAAVPQEAVDRWVAEGRELSDEAAIALARVPVPDPAV
jgi:predicted ATPase/class 3 adenylate cyclase